MTKYVAYDATAGEYHEFDTFEDAEKFLADADFSEGFPHEFETGQSYIAEITHVSAIEVTDKKENYPCSKFPGMSAECAICVAGDNDCDAEEWPYSNEFDYTGRGYMRPVKDSALHAASPELLAELLTWCDACTGKGFDDCADCRTGAVVRKARGGQ